ncbi:hypothetical protein KCH_55420 [Kitasatospora cheerisanensis KCTC 2395]|uniref:Uncharacterized protein n=1 Tax=Kitasatospora cheerisanensis KCTC 2395 TaxID=1348663 RepID=A0A066YN99_9ACTN|nr:hypothetical protein KCH_55420 [Kitasatospora cheerisanensis KCTC 2395]
MIAGVSKTIESVRFPGTSYRSSARFVRIVTHQIVITR